MPETPETAMRPEVPDEIRAAALVAVNAAQWEDGHRYGEHGQHAFNAACAVCQGDMERVLPVALAAVLPAHEAMVRAKVAEEFMAAEVRVEGATYDHAQGIADGMKLAADIARGERL